MGPGDYAGSRPREIRRVTVKGKIERNLKEAGSLDSVGKRGSKERGNWPVTEGKRANFGWGLSLR